MDTIANGIGTWIVGLSYDDLPPEVVKRAKQCILDQLGVQMRGATLPQVQPVRQLVEAMGGTPEATVAEDFGRLRKQHLRLQLRV